MNERDERPDLDDELRRLFADDRLDLPVARNASAAVVAGARRRRRNRVALTAAGGVLAVVAFVSAGLTLSGIGRPTTVPAATGPVLTMTVPTATPAASAPTTAPQPEADGLYVLGPDGYEKLMLGMPLAEATAAGLFRKTSSATVSAGCLRYTMLINGTYVRSSPAAGSGATPSIMPVKGQLEVLVSLREGVVELNGDPLLRTPEGIGVGAPEEILVQVYPQLYMSRGTATVQVSGNPKANYVFGLSGAGTVTSFSLRLAKSDCPG
jgi:hypothetical protein